jgi:hypothetical protein
MQTTNFIFPPEVGHTTETCSGYWIKYSKQRCVRRKPWTWPTTRNRMQTTNFKTETHDWTGEGHDRKDQMSFRGTYTLRSPETSRKWNTRWATEIIRSKSWISQFLTNRSSIFYFRSCLPTFRVACGCVAKLLGWGTECKTCLIPSFVEQYKFETPPCYLHVISAVVTAVIRGFPQPFQANNEIIF